MRCPLEYKLSLEFEGEQKVSGAMQYGTEVHAALESLLEGDLGVGQVLGTNSALDFGCCQDSVCSFRADTVDVGQRDPYLLLGGDSYP